MPKDSSSLCLSYELTLHIARLVTSTRTFVSLLPHLAVRSLMGYLRTVTCVEQSTRIWRWPARLSCQFGAAV